MPVGCPRSLQPHCSLQMTVLLLLVSLVLTPQWIMAQEPPPGLVEVREGGRRGFWFGLGVGAGGESNDVGSPGYSALYYQPTISLRAGGTVNPHLRLGGEILSWFDEQGDATVSLTSALFVAQFYPLRSSGLYLKGGLGIGRNAVDFDNGLDVGDTGFAGLLGAGLELRLGRRLFLNPAVDLVGHSYNSRIGGDYTERLVNFGLGIVFQTGR
jgi:Outer membrane protein beta-barrel domain